MSSHQEYVDAIKSSAIATAKKQLLSALLKKVPFLFWGPLSPIVSLLVEKALEILVNETEFAIYFKYIDMRVDSQGRAFSEAAIKNHKIQQSGTPEEIANSEKELIEKFRAFVILGS